MSVFNESQQADLGASPAALSVIQADGLAGLEQEQLSSPDMCGYVTALSRLERIYDTKAQPALTREQCTVHAYLGPRSIYTALESS